MLIERAELYLVPLELREPFESSAGAVHVRSILLVALHGGGMTGWGECVAGETPHYSPETTETAWAALTERLLPSIMGKTLTTDPESLAHQWKDFPGHPMARAAVEMASWDLDAKRRGIPLCTALGGRLTPVPAGVSIGLQRDDDALYRRVERFLEEGYRRIKVKIKPRRDIMTLRGIRDRFGNIPLMADANSAYTIGDMTVLREMDDFILMMIEQPLAPDDFDGHAKLQGMLLTPICLDESIVSLDDAERALDLGSCRVINIKPGRVGGLSHARAIHDFCRERDVPVWCGGMLESGIGRAHNVALATLPGFTLPGDISASRRYFEKDLVTPEWEIEDGALTPHEGPGIGVEVDLPRIAELSVRRSTIG